MSPKYKAALQIELFSWNTVDPYTLASSYLAQFLGHITLNIFPKGPSKSLFAFRTSKQVSTGDEGLIHPSLSLAEQTTPCV